jgi:hypothetical protein
VVIAGGTIVVVVVIKLGVVRIAGTLSRITHYKKTDTQQHYRAEDRFRECAKCQASHQNVNLPDSYSSPET